MKQISKTLAGVHTHTHTHTGIFTKRNKIGLNCTKKSVVVLESNFKNLIKNQIKDSKFKRTISAFENAIFLWGNWRNTLSIIF